MNRLFPALWLIIIFVSAHDGYLVLAHRNSMVDFELNPLGRWLLACNDGDIWIFLAAKSIGTLVAAALLLVVYWSWPPIGWIACAITAALQLLLMLYLYS